jgi:hypothetical protein
MIQRGDEEGIPSMGRKAERRWREEWRRGEERRRWRVGEEVGESLTGNGFSRRRKLSLD